MPVKVTLTLPVERPWNEALLEEIGREIYRCLYHYMVLDIESLSLQQGTVEKTLSKRDLAHQRKKKETL